MDWVIVQNHGQSKDYTQTKRYIEAFAGEKEVSTAEA
jgi:hypothetical protein